MGLFPAKSDIRRFKSLAKQIRYRSKRGSFDGALVLEMAEYLLEKYPLPADLYAAAAARYKDDIIEDYFIVARFVMKMKRSQIRRMRRDI